jgi:3',5'-cyclic AMP phosphodiesterase CpdA
MPDTCFAWLHLTDLHYGLKGQDCLWPSLRQPFLDDLGALHDRCGPWDAVLFTGDLVQSGEPDQFAAMQRQVLDPL